MEDNDDAANDDDEQSHDHHTPHDHIDGFYVVSSQEEDLRRSMRQRQPSIRYSSH